IPRVIVDSPRVIELRSKLIALRSTLLASSPRLPASRSNRPAERTDRPHEEIRLTLSRSAQSVRTAIRIWDARRGCVSAASSSGTPIKELRRKRLWPLRRYGGDRARNSPPQDSESEHG